MVLIRPHLLDNTTSLQNDLSLCSAPSTNDTAAIVILQTLYTTAFTCAVEFNYATASLGRTPIPYPFDYTINKTLEASNPLEILNSTLWIWYETQGYPCINWTDPDFGGQIVPGIQRIPFSYIVCRSSSSTQCRSIAFHMTDFVKVPTYPYAAGLYRRVQSSLSTRIFVSVAKQAARVLTMPRC